MITCDPKQCYLRSCKGGQDWLCALRKEERCRLDPCTDVVPLILYTSTPPSFEPSSKGL